MQVNVTCSQFLIQCCVYNERKFLQIKDCWDLFGVIVHQGSQLIPFLLRWHVRGSVLELGNGVILKKYFY